MIGLENIGFLRYVANAKKTFENFDLMRQNFMLAYFFHEDTLDEANFKVKSLNISS